MYVLVVRDPEGNETEYDLVGEALLGRDDTADIQMPDPGVSRRHARVFLEDGLCYVEDLGSANGSTIEGEPIVGAVVLDPGRIVAMGPFELWVEEGDEAGGDLAGTDSGPALAEPSHVERTHSSVRAPVTKGRRMVGTLEGISGAALGQVFEVRDGAVVGRLPGVDIVVDDPSVSRRHAEIRVVGNEILLRDLESANGTFVNEEPVLQQPLQEGDLVTFGSVAFSFSFAGGVQSALVAGGGAPGVPAVPSRGRGGGRGKGGPPGRRKLLIAVAGAFALLMVILVVAGRGDPPPTPALPGGPDTKESKEETDLRREVFNLMRRGQMLMDSESWGEAEDRFARVVELDPINRDAREKLDQCRMEARMQELFEEGSRLAQLGHLEEAMQVFTRIDGESIYRRRARFQAHQMVERMQARYDGDCRGYVRANRFREALEPCRKYMDFACQCPETMNDAVEEALEKAESRANVPVSERWRCPPNLEEWVPCASRMQGAGSDPAQAAIRQRYDREAVAGAVLAYYRGRPEEAIREMGRARDDLSGNPAAAREASNLRDDMRIAQASFRQIQTELRRNDMDRAKSALDQLVAHDEKIVPEPYQSSIRREALRMVSGAFHDRGFDLQSMRRYPEAFEWYRKGYEINPDDTRIGEAIRRLESVGRRALGQAQTCGELRQILRYTMEDGVIHQQVKEAMARRGC